MESDVHAALSLLDHENKLKRHQGLDAIKKIISDETVSPNLSAVFSIIHKPLVCCLGDLSEVNRLSSSEVLIEFIEKEAFSEDCLVNVIPLMSHRLCSRPQIEESEDVHTNFLLIIRNIIEHQPSSEQLVFYMSDIVSILVSSLQQTSPEIKILAAEVTCSYGLATKRKFHLQCESLVKPLIGNISHQRFRVRVAALNAIGTLLIHGDSKIIEDVSCPISQCFMDIPQVRLAAVKLAGQLATAMPDRYSYWHRILPSLLSGLRDDDPEVRKSATALWIKAGEQYEEENEEELKQKLQVYMPPKDFPESEQVFGVGCMELVARSIYHMVPALVNDLNFWQDQPRVHAAKLLVTLVLSAQHEINQYMERIMGALLMAMKDTSQDAVAEITVFVRYLSYFVSPDIFLRLIEDRLSSDDEAPLFVLKAFLEGSTCQFHHDDAEKYIKKLSDPHLAFSLRLECNEALVDVLHILITRLNSPSAEVSYQLFYLILYLVGLRDKERIVQKGKELLRLIKEKLGPSESELLRQFAVRSLNEVKLCSEVWSSSSPELTIFLSLLQVSGPVILEHQDVLTSVVDDAVLREDHPLVTLYIFEALRSLYHCEEDAALNLLIRWIPTFINDYLVEILKWQPGKTKEALRTVGVANLLSVIQLGSKEETLMKAVSRRLDDVVKKVRMQASSVLHSMASNLPVKLHPQEHTEKLQTICSQIVIYLDEDEPLICSNVAETVMLLGLFFPDYILNVLGKWEKYRNQRLCENILTHFNSLTAVKDS